MKNYYEILGLPNFATALEAKKAFKALAMQYHPDKNPDDKTAEEKFKLINEAHRILTNEQAKANYDSLLESGYNQDDIAELAKKSEEYQRRQQQKYAAYQDFLRRNAKKDYHVTNTQAALIAIFVVGYALAFGNNLVNAYSRVQYLFGLAAFEKKEYKIAVSHLERSVETDGSFERSSALLGKINLEKLGHYGEAVENYGKAIRNAEKENPEYFYQQGLAHCHLGNEAGAKPNFDKLLVFYPDSMRLKQQIADHYFYVLRSDTLSAEMYKLILKTDSTKHEALVNLGSIYYNHGNFRWAADYFSRSIGRGNQAADVFAKRSLSYLSLQNTPLACQDWKKAKSLSPDLRHDVLDFFCADSVQVSEVRE